MTNSNNPLVLDESMAPVDAEQVALLAPDENDEDSMLADLLEIFMEESAPRIAEIEKLCQAQDAQALRIPVHFIAGSSANLGATRVSQLCRQVEAAILGNSFDAFNDLPETLKREYAAGVSALKEAARLN